MSYKRISKTSWIAALALAFGMGSAAQAAPVEDTPIKDTHLARLELREVFPAATQLNNDRQVYPWTEPESLLTQAEWERMFEPMTPNPAALDPGEDIIGLPPVTPMMVRYSGPLWDNPNLQLQYRHQLLGPGKDYDFETSVPITPQLDFAFTVDDRSINTYAIQRTVKF